MRWLRDSNARVASALGVVIVACLGATQAIGQETSRACTAPATDLESGRLFGELKAMALEINAETCVVLAQGPPARFDAHLAERIREFAIYTRATAVGAFSGLPIESLELPFDDLVDRFSDHAFAVDQLPELTVHLSDLAGEWLVFHFDDRVRAGHIADASDDQACVSRLGVACAEALDDFAAAFNSYKTSVESLSAANVSAALDELSAEWDTFLADGRSQTPLDLMLTTALERRHLRQGLLISPPSRQWSMLRPGLVFEHRPESLSDSPNGLAVAVEWFGVNWWSDRSPLFGMPFGVSMTTVYSAGPNHAGAGHGLALHFDNHYTVGWTRRAGERSYFFSIDLMQLIDDRQQRLDRYRERVRDLRIDRNDRHDRKPFRRRTKRAGVLRPLGPNGVRPRRFPQESHHGMSSMHRR